MDKAGYEGVVGFNLDGSHLEWQNVSVIEFIREFREFIHCAHVKGVWVAREHCRAGRLGGHRPMGHWANGWNFVTAGTARDANSLEEIFIELNRVGFDGAVSHRVGGQRRRAARRGEDGAGQLPPGRQSAQRHAARRDAEGVTQRVHVSRSRSEASAKREQDEGIMKILVIDVGGTHIKILASGETEPRKIPSGSAMTPQQMVDDVTEAAADWAFEAVSIGYPGFVFHGKAVCDPFNLAPGWVGCDFETAFGRPVKLINDAAMQALGSYEGGRMLFLGLGTGLGSALILDGEVEPMELAHLPYRKRRTFEDYLGERGLKKLGRKKWEEHVHDVAARMMPIFAVDYIVIGGGNVHKLKVLPEGASPGRQRQCLHGRLPVVGTGGKRARDGAAEKVALCWSVAKSRDRDLIPCRLAGRRLSSILMPDVTQILNAIENGDPDAAGQLLPLVYDELRRLAAQRLAQEKPGQTLQATALVHEAYLRLVSDERRSSFAPNWNSRGHFFAAAAEAMRRILVENVRRKRSLKRGGDRGREAFDPVEICAPEPVEDLLALDEAPGEAGGPGPGQGRTRQAALLRGVDHRGSRRGSRHVRRHGQTLLDLCPHLALSGNQRRRGGARRPEKGNSE